MFFKRLILCLNALVMLSVSAYPITATAVYRGENPEKMMTLKEFQIMGVTIDMRIEDILKKLQAQGHELVCRSHGCKIRGDGFEFILMHTNRIFGNRNPSVEFDRNATPISIGIGNVTDFSVCHSAKEMIQSYCNKDGQKQPCWTNNFGITNGDMSAKSKSADGYLYSATVMLNPSKTCSIGIKRQ